MDFQIGERSEEATIYPLVIEIACTMEKKTLIEELNEFNEFPVPTYEEWKEAAIKSLKGADFNKRLLTETYEGITLQPMYQRKDIENLDTASFPGEYPYLRSTTVLDYVQKPWDVAQEIQLFDPKSFNEVSKKQLTVGQTALNIRIDNQQMKNKEHEVTFSGTSMLDYEDVKTAFNGIDLENVPLYVNAPLFPMAYHMMIVEVMKEQGQDSSKLTGSIAYDPIATLATNGSLKVNLKKSLDWMAEQTKWAIEHTPNVQTILVSGHHYKNGGGNAIDELTYTFATAVYYIRELQSRGLSIDDIAPRIRFEFSIGSKVFIEISKLRAARAIWANIISAFGGNETSQKIHIHARTARFTKTVYDPYVNMLRGTVEAFSAIIGGVESLHVSPFDEEIREYDEFAERIARNTQLILNEESHLSKVADPAGGSWFIESLTFAFAENVWKAFQDVEKNGTIIDALESNVVQAKLNETKEKQIANIKKRKDVFVGTNMYPNLQEEAISSNDEEHQKLRDAYWSGKELKACSTEISSVESLEAALKDGVSIPSIIDTFTPEQLTVTPIEEFRGAELFEELRRNADRYMEKNGNRPVVYLATLGALKVHKPRADFAKAFFETGGFAINYGQGSETAEEAAKKAIDAKAKIVVISSTDEYYEKLAADTARLIKEQATDVTIVLAGKPTEELQQSLKSAGVEHMIYAGCNTYDLLALLQKEKGVLA